MDNNNIRKIALLLSDRISMYSLGISGIMVGCYFLILFIQVISRYLFKYSFPWAEEFALYVNIWAVMLTGNVLIAKNELIRVDFFDSLWSKRFIFYRDKFFNVMLALLLCVLCWEGYKQAVYGMNTYLTSVNISLFWAYMALPVGVGLMILQYILLIIK